MELQIIQSKIFKSKVMRLKVFFFRSGTSNKLGLLFKGAGALIFQTNHYEREYPKRDYRY